MEKKIKDDQLIIAINTLKILILLMLTLYNVEWHLVDSFLYFIQDIFFAFFRNFKNITFYIYLGAEWIILSFALYLLSTQKKYALRIKYSLWGGLPFVGILYGLFLKFNRKNTT